jgi:hypothetical protein
MRRLMPIVTEMCRILLCVEFWKKFCQGEKICLFGVLDEHITGRLILSV